ncbi:hypothetical protein [Corallococcus carmarthensis]|uniref:hypothetical protein n=1 Tax=Corallococcus carmarthensis TaxID=2316728 RepID=UPI0011C4A054|nr:hypothetical protein [Corallococcus carmarthensis]
MHCESKSGLAVLGGALWCLLALVGSPAYAICPNPPPPPTSCVNANGCYGMTECDEYPTCGSFTGASTVSCTVCGRGGTRLCDAEGNILTGSCSAYGAEQCDGCDNDGDSLIDEGPNGGALTGGSCDPLSNGCTGTLTCTGGQFQCVIPSGTRRSCAPPEYACENATAACLPNGAHGPCRPAVRTSEKCNRCDDDWDGLIDNLPGQGIGTLTQECRTSAGTCAGSVQACVVGTNSSFWGACVAPTESCNGLDDDCDGNIDEGDVCALFCACTPTTCAAQGKTCGVISDGCGGSLSCGTCGAGQTCNNNVCTCQPTTCAAAGKTCGVISDGCGGSLSCGICDEGETCVNNQCVCQPTTCAAAGATCGLIANGCGGSLNCGSCPTGQSCGLDHACFDKVTCPPLQYLCCDQQTCSRTKGCPEIACQSGAGGGEVSSPHPAPRVR